MLVCDSAVVAAPCTVLATATAAPQKSYQQNPHLDGTMVAFGAEQNQEKLSAVVGRLSGASEPWLLEFVARSVREVSTCS